MNPNDYVPRAPSDLIGGARAVAEAMLRRTAKIESDNTATLKTLLYGAPGIGKTRVAEMIARGLSQGVDIETINGRNLTIDVVRDWQRSSCYGSLFGGWKIKIINEADLIPAQAQDLMLSFLDELRPRSCVIATSNLDIKSLSERFKTRFELVKVTGADVSDLASWLAEKWEIPESTAKMIALGTCGNVRQALLDAAKWLTFKTAPDETRPRLEMVRSYFGKGAAA